jgi:hypothetical protein
MTIIDAITKTLIALEIAHDRAAMAMECDYGYDSGEFTRGWHVDALARKCTKILDDYPGDFEADVRALAVDDAEAIVRDALGDPPEDIPFEGADACEPPLEYFDEDARDEILTYAFM